MYSEIITITNEATKVIAFDAPRQAKYGSAMTLQVWLLREDGKYYLTDVQPVVDDAPPSLGQVSYDFGDAVTGFIVIK